MLEVLSLSPIANSLVDNVLVRIARDLNQPLYQFINALVMCVGKHVPEWSYTSGNQLVRNVGCLKVKNLEE